MNKVLILFLSLIITQAFGQKIANRHDRITKEEFRELVKYRDEFIPEDLGESVLIVRYSGQRLMQMQNKARNSSFALNGADTVGLRIESWLTEKQFERHKVSMEKSSSRYPARLAKELKRKGINSIVVDEDRLNEKVEYSKMYWLQTTFICSQKSLIDNGWVLTTTNMFFDPRTKKSYKVFLPLNYSLIELMD